MAIPSITVTPDQAARAYRSVELGDGIGQADGHAGPDFGAVLGQALQGAVDAGRDADTRAMAAIGGGGDITSVVTALSRADLALQTTVAIRDKVVAAYQDILKMPI